LGFFCYDSRIEIINIMLDYKNELNVEQLAVVEKGDGPCLVLAGAGSGKTRTITYRVAYLLEQGIDPHRILLVTFTNKAAREMKQRIEVLLEKSETQAKLNWVGTFHHICFRVLKQYATLLEYDNNFTILDSEDSRVLLKLCIKSEGIERGKNKFPSPKVIQGIISYAKNAMMTIEDVIEKKYPNWQSISEIVTRIAIEYRRRKREANAMDFDDMLVNTYLLLSGSNSVRTKFATQFQYVLVDEYQDTNKIQASIIDVISSMHNNIVVVGDDAQSIYSFRAADVKNILAFEHKYPNAKVFKLETNYRSTPNILDIANVVIENNTSQYKKNLKSVQEPFAKPEVRVFADNREEAEFIADRIIELQEEGVELKNIAVLFRAAYHSQALEVELTKRNISYDYRGGTRFFERSHIKDVLAYLKIFENKQDIVAWHRVLTMQVGIGPKTVEKIMEQIKKGLIDTDVEKIKDTLGMKAKVGFNNFLDVWNDIQDCKSTPTDLIHAVLDSSYVDYLESEYDNYRDRIQDIEQLAVFSESEKELGKFLAEVAMQESYKQAQTQEDGEKIVLSTIHQAKGLEWSAVFILHLSAGEFPNQRALKEHKGVEEERRLFYVAVTRAKKYLHLTYPLVAGFNNMFGGPSMFLDEIDKHLIEEYGSLGEVNSWEFTDPSDDVDDIQYIPEGEEYEHAKRKRSFLKDIDDL
jgi:DNA helicase II / ATP-dependent DNA helicase PcrA